MKKIGLLLLTIIFAAGCSSTKKPVVKEATTKHEKNSDLVSFEYEAVTRGSYLKVIVTQDTITTIKDHTMKNVVSRPISKADWNSLVKTTDKFDVEGLENLKAPSNKSFSDGAMGANLKVIKKEKTYGSKTFDHGNPPAEISQLVNKIIQMSDLPKTK